MSGNVNLINVDKMKSKSIIDLGLGLIGTLILIAAVTKVRLLFNLFHFQNIWQEIILITYFASAIVAFIGLLRVRPWGFIAAYTHILIATFLLSISVFPFLFKLVRLDYSTATKVLVISNVAVLLLIAVLHGIRRSLINKIPKTS